jgi:hypothetical protein
MRNILQPGRGAGVLAHAVVCAALVGLASAGCDASPVAERAGEDLTHETEAARDDAGEGGAVSELPQGAASDSGDAPVASDVAPAAYDEPATAASGLDPSSEDSQPAEPAGESAVDSATETGGSQLGNSGAAANQAIAEPAAIKPPTRPPADRTPRRPGDAEKISFDDLNLGMAVDMVYRPFLLNDRVKELDGQKVSIMGYIHAGASASKVKEFVLLKNTECKFGAGGQADHLAMVYLAPGETTKYQLDAIKVEGKLVVKPFQGPDGNTWSVYDLVEAKVVR